MSSVSAYGDRYAPSKEWHDALFASTCGSEMLSKINQCTSNTSSSPFKAADSVGDRHEQAYLITQLCKKQIEDTNLPKLQVDV